MVNKWCYENFEKATKKDNDSHKFFFAIAHRIVALFALALKFN
jgi:hypothetical protein